MRVQFPETNVVGCKFLGWDGRKGGLLDNALKEIPLADEVHTKEYFYRNDTGETLYIDDIVVTSCRTGFQVCIVTSRDVIRPKEVENALSPVVAKVDVSGYAEIVSKREELTRMRRELEDRKKQLERGAIYEMLAKEDADFAEMLRLYKEKGGEL